MLVIINIMINILLAVIIVHSNNKCNHKALVVCSSRFTLEQTDSSKPQELCDYIYYDYVLLSLREVYLWL